MNLMEALDLGYNILKLNNIHTYKIDTEILLSDTLNISKEKLILNLKENISDKNYNNFLSKLNRRKSREPVAYIIKKKEFWKNEFYLDRNVLIPRPETEYLVEETLKIISQFHKKKILEIGIGSGCLIISILKERQLCSADGIDSSKKAVKVAKINAKLHQIKNRIKIFKSDVDNYNVGKYDLIVSNPPYIDTHQLKYLGVKEYEPYTALNGGINGTEVLMKVVVKASQLLKVNGKLIIEIGKDQKYKMIKFLNTNNFFVKKIIRDLSGHDRCIISVKLS